MIVKILADTIASGKRVKKGKEYDVSDKDAQYLCGINKAEIAKAPEVEPVINEKPTKENHKAGKKK